MASLRCRVSPGSVTTLVSSASSGPGSMAEANVAVIHSAEGTMKCSAVSQVPAVVRLLLMGARGNLQPAQIIEHGRKGRRKMTAGQRQRPAHAA